MKLFHFKPGRATLPFRWIAPSDQHIAVTLWYEGGKKDDRESA